MRIPFARCLPANNVYIEMITCNSQNAVICTIDVLYCKLVLSAGGAGSILRWRPKFPGYPQRRDFKREAVNATIIFAV